MFQLIIASIAIVLAAAMAIGGVYYLGGAFVESSDKAKYAEYVNNAAQIDAAMQLYFNENARYPDGENEELLNNLRIAGYLKATPAGGWLVTPTTLFRPIDSVEECASINSTAGYDVETTDLPAEYEGCPPCNGFTEVEQEIVETFKDWPGCRQID